MIVFTFMLALTTLVGCSSQGTSSKKEISLEKLLTDMKEQIAEDMKKHGVEDALVDGELMGYIEGDLKSVEDYTAAIILEKMAVEKDAFAEGVVLAPMMNINSNQIIVIKANSTDDVDTLKAALEKEHDAQVQMWSQYLPDQYEKVKNNQIVVEGNYLFYVTYENPDKLIEIFKGQFE